jgi:hypothetical protein
MNATPADSVPLKHMDEIKSATNWALGIAFTATILALQDGDNLKVLQFELSRPIAFFALSLIYNSICLAITIHLVRISEHLGSIPTAELDACFSRLLSHEWLFNPFISYDALGPRFRGFWGLSALISLFWFGLSGLALVYVKGPSAFWYLLPNPGAVRTPNWLEIIGGFAGFLGCFLALGLFVVIGYAAMAVILDIPVKMAARLETLDPERAPRFRRMATELKGAADIGIGLGGFVLIMVWGASSFLRWPAAIPAASPY